MTLGSTAGANAAEASVPGLAGSPLGFTATAVAGPGESLAAVSGDGQTAQVGDPLPSPFVVAVSDSSGNPVAGATIVFDVTGGSGSLSQTVVATDTLGRAQTTFTLGAGAGAHTVTASGAGLVNSPLTFTATATPGPADVLAVVAGDGQTGIAGQALGAGGTGHERGEAVAAMPDGGAVVVGRFAASATFGPGEANETTLVSAGGDDVFVARYAPDGTLVSARRAGGTSLDYGLGVAPLPDGGVVVTGSYQSAATFGPGEANETTLPMGLYNNGFVARFAYDGDLVWVRAATGTGELLSQDVAALPDGTTWVTGAFGGSATFGSGEANETILTAVHGHDVFVARYAANGTLQWANRAGGTSWEKAPGVAVSPDGTAVVTGDFLGTATLD